MTDLSRAIWRKASLSNHNGGCVEIAANLPGVVAVRDSKRPDAGALLSSPRRSPSSSRTSRRAATTSDSPSQKKPPGPHLRGVFYFAAPVSRLAVFCRICHFTHGYVHQP